jgi:hypothetical protein
MTPTTIRMILTGSMLSFAGRFFLLRVSETIYAGGHAGGAEAVIDVDHSNV